MEKNKRYALGFGLAMAVGAALAIASLLLYLVDAWDWIIGDIMGFFEALFSQPMLIFLVWLPLVAGILLSLGAALNLKSFFCKGKMDGLACAV